jgi:hypothetical protein
MRGFAAEGPVQAVHNVSLSAAKGDSLLLGLVLHLLATDLLAETGCRNQDAIGSGMGVGAHLSVGGDAVDEALFVVAGVQTTKGDEEYQRFRGCYVHLFTACSADPIRRYQVLSS